MVRLFVVDVRFETYTENLMVILEDPTTNKFLAIWIGSVEAAAIVSALEGHTPEAPGTHDLLIDVLHRCDYKRIEGRITSAHEGVFTAELVIDDHHLPARPSDVIALAVRDEFAIMCPKQLIAEVGVEMLARDEPEMQRFRNFLDNISPEDF